MDAVARESSEATDATLAAEGRYLRCSLTNSASLRSAKRPSTILNVLPVGVEQGKGMRDVDE